VLRADGAGVEADALSWLRAIKPSAPSGRRLRGSTASTIILLGNSELNNGDADQGQKRRAVADQVLPPSSFN
jgi:hypothetical protein